MITAQPTPNAPKVKAKPFDINAWMRAAQDAGLSRGAKGLMTDLFPRMDSKSGCIRPCPLRRMAREINASVSSLVGWRKELLSAGMLERVPTRKFKVFRAVVPDRVRRSRQRPKAEPLGPDVPFADFHGFEYVEAASEGVFQNLEQKRAENQHQNVPESGTKMCQKSNSPKPPNKVSTSVPASVPASVPPCSVPEKNFTKKEKREEEDAGAQTRTCVVPTPTPQLAPTPKPQPVQVSTPARPQTQTLTQPTPVALSTLKPQALPEVATPLAPVLDTKDRDALALPSSAPLSSSSFSLSLSSPGTTDTTATKPTASAPPRTPSKQTQQDAGQQAGQVFEGGGQPSTPSPVATPAPVQAPQARARHQMQSCGSRWVEPVLPSEEERQAKVEANKRAYNAAVASVSLPMVVINPVFPTSSRSSVPQNHHSAAHEAESDAPAQPTDLDVLPAKHRPVVGAKVEKDAAEVVAAWQVRWRKSMGKSMASGWRRWCGLVLPYLTANERAELLMICVGDGAPNLPWMTKVVSRIISERPPTPRPSTRNTTPTTGQHTGPPRKLIGTREATAAELKARGLPPGMFLMLPKYADDDSTTTTEATHV